MQPIATIRHPQKPEVCVKLRKPTVAEELALSDEDRNSRRPEAVMVGGQPLRDPKGEVVIVWRSTRSTMDVQCARIRKFSAGWEGVTDPDGKVLPWDAKHIPVLWEDHLFADLPRCFQCDLESHPDHWYPDHPDFDANEEMHPLMKRVPFGLLVNRASTLTATFDPDPTPAVSATP